VEEEEEEQERSRAFERGCKEDPPRTRPAKQRIELLQTAAESQLSGLITAACVQNWDLSHAVHEVTVYVTCRE
jgi:hypothetical protein